MDRETEIRWKACVLEAGRKREGQERDNTLGRGERNRGRKRRMTGCEEVGAWTRVA